MATATVTPEVTASQPHSIFDNALLLVITRKWIPQTKTIRNKVLQSNADPKMVSANKKLFDCKELRAIVRNEEKLDEYLKWKSTPFPLQKGHHLVGADLFHEVENRILSHVTKRNLLIDEFVAVYEKAVTDAKLLLGDQFNQGDYLSVEQVRNTFRFQWDYLQFTVSEKLRELDKSVAERKEEEWKTQIIQAGQAADSLLSAQFKLLIDGLNEKLTPTGELNEDGTEKKKKLREDALNKINAFLRDMPARNINENTQLKAFADQASVLLKDVTTAKLKESDTLKKQVAEGFASLKSTLDQFVVEQGERSITFD